MTKDFPAYPTLGAYLDSATIGLRPLSSIVAQTDYIKNIGANVRLSLHSMARKALDEYLGVKEKIASVFNCNPENLAFQFNTDLAWNLITKSISTNRELTFIASIFDPHSILAPLVWLAAQKSIKLNLLTSRTNKELGNELQDKISNGSVLIISSISPVLGEVREIKTLRRICQDNGSKIFVDYSRTAIQSLVDLDGDASDLSIIDGSIDLLGPEATTIIHIKDKDEINFNYPASGLISYIETNDIGLNSSPEIFEVGSPNLSGIVGVKASLQYLQNLRFNKIEEHNMQLHQYLKKQFESFDDFKIQSLNSKNNGSIFTFSSDQISSHDIALFLSETNVQVRSGLLCSHMGIEQLNIRDVVQVSTHVYNTKNHIDDLIVGLQQVISMFQ